jgi:hypothetical protein
MKTLEKFKENSGFICIGLFLLLFIKQCNVSSDQDKIQKDLKKITSRIDSIPSEAQIQKRLNETMFNFLIYEDDFDRKKISLSEIRSKLDVTK